MKPEIDIIIPQDEQMTMPGEQWFSGKRVLELGNKKNSAGLYRKWYNAAMVYDYRCVDWNGEDGALRVDMGRALDPDCDLIGTADIVTNFGFSEHVFTNQEQCWRNIFAMASKMGCFLSVVLPYPGYWEHHGVYQPTPGWLQAIMVQNGFALHTATVNDNRRRWVTCTGGERVDPYNPDEFVWPDPTFEPMKEHTCPLGKGLYITKPLRRNTKSERNCGVE